MTKEMEKAIEIATSLTEDDIDKALERIKNRKGFPLNTECYIVTQEELSILQQAIERLDKYEQILGSGRLTHWNYKNTTLPLESCKPLLRLGQLEDIYEEEHKNE